MAVSETMIVIMSVSCLLVYCWQSTTASKQMANVASGRFNGVTVTVTT